MCGVLDLADPLCGMITKGCTCCIFRPTSRIASSHSATVAVTNSPEWRDSNTRHFVEANLVHMLCLTIGLRKYPQKMTEQTFESLVQPPEKKI